jgi:hypothetical protein
MRFQESTSETAFKNTSASDSDATQSTNGDEAALPGINGLAGLIDGGDGEAAYIALDEHCLVTFAQVLTK